MVIIIFFLSNIITNQILNERIKMATLMVVYDVRSTRLMNTHTAHTYWGEKINKNKTNNHPSDAERVDCV